MNYKFFATLLIAVAVNYSCFAIDFAFPLELGNWMVSQEIGQGLHTDEYNGYYSLDVDNNNLAGVKVLAALGGKISVLQRDVACKLDNDIMKDVTKQSIASGEAIPSIQDAALIKTLYLGNNIAIEHEGGYKTIYAHLRCGSIPSSFTVGTRIERGTQLGTIGNSGNSGVLTFIFP